MPLLLSGLLSVFVFFVTVRTLLRPIDGLLHLIPRFGAPQAALGQKVVEIREAALLHARCKFREYRQAATGARHVLISAGFQNAFGHPAEATLERWRARNARIWRTDEEGAITFDLTQNANITTERRTHPRYWRPAPPAN